MHKLKYAFEQQDENGVKLVCNLQKSLYGITQSGRNLNIYNIYIIREESPIFAPQRLRF